ncbi:MAG TPA: TIGR03435 family protein [Bryobacteraceae bacterium]|nr:TIGR03435 family protein [Bryobacteraceae bacterium]
MASVKLATAGAGGVEGGCHGIDSTFGPSEKAPPPLGRCVITNARLGHLINIAFELNSMQLIKSGPDWIARGVERYNVEAKTEDPTKTTEKQLLQMLRALLVERFQMKFHRETVEGPGFAMVVGKNGPKFKESAAEEEKIVFGGEFPSKPVPGRPVSLTARKYTMAMLANLLSQIAGHGTILDKTGLTGAYDLKLSWDEENGPAFTTAVPEQLGLRLEAQKVPVSMLVVDSAQKPGEN